MRILAVADIHGNKLKKDHVLQKIVLLKPDVLVIAGDICGRFGIDGKKMVEWMDHLPVKVLAVRGNSDSRKLEGLFAAGKNITELNFRQLEIKGLPFCGISGTLALPFNTKVAWNQNSSFKKLAPLVGPSTILVAHPPPQGYRDRVMGKFSAGCQALLKLVQERKPRLYICGHIHEDPGVAFIGETLIVNCSLSKTGQGAIIDISPDGGQMVRML